MLLSLPCVLKSLCQLFANGSLEALCCVLAQGVHDAGLAIHCIGAVPGCRHSGQSKLLVVLLLRPVGVEDVVDHAVFVRVACCGDARHVLCDAGEGDLRQFT